MKTLVGVTFVGVAALLVGFSRKQQPVPPADAPPSIACLTPIGLAAAGLTPEQGANAAAQLQTTMNSAQTARAQYSTALNQLAAAVSAARNDPLASDATASVTAAQNAVASARNGVVAAEQSLADAAAAALGAQPAGVLRRVPVVARRQLPTGFAVVEMDAATLRAAARGARMAAALSQVTDPDTGELIPQTLPTEGPVAVYIQLRDRTDVMTAQARIDAVSPHAAPVAPRQ